jgi:hypothetical protein
MWQMPQRKTGRHVMILHMLIGGSTMTTQSDTTSSRALYLFSLYLFLSYTSLGFLISVLAIWYSVA